MNPNLPNSFRSGPDERGHFGNFGGRFVAETLMRRAIRRFSAR
jgi:tryptophan synthase beta chain